MKVGEISTKTPGSGTQTLEVDEKKWVEMFAKQLTLNKIGMFLNTIYCYFLQ
jgi:hypothetical protein